MNVLIYFFWWKVWTCWSNRKLATVGNFLLIFLRHASPMNTLLTFCVCHQSIVSAYDVCSLVRITALWWGAFRCLLFNLWGSSLSSLLLIYDSIVNCSNEPIILSFKWSKQHSRGNPMKMSIRASSTDTDNFHRVPRYLLLKIEKIPAILIKIPADFLNFAIAINKT